MRRRARAVAAAMLFLAGCRVTNYVEPAHPFYATHDGVARDTEPGLRVVTFNVKEGEKIAEAIAALGGHPDLRDADLVLLQEMNAQGVAAVARALRMNSAYFPATRQPGGGRDWGNAVLSPWPIEDPHKVLLPHLGRFRRRGRTATSVLVRYGARAIRVYSTHLGSPWDTTESSRKDQALRILDDAERSREPVVVAGDFNSETVGQLFAARGYCWPTRDRGATIHRFSVDHVFARGLCTAASRGGVARDVEDASDHRPVWAILG